MTDGEVEMDEGRRRYEFKKALERLEAKQGAGTEADHASSLRTSRSTT